MEPENTTTPEAKPRQRFTRSRVLLGMVVLCLLLWSIKAIHHAMQPQYQGKTVEEWFEEVSFSADDSRTVTADPAVIALKQLGTNAVWYLWREQIQSDSTVKLILRNIQDEIAGNYRAGPTVWPGKEVAPWFILYEFGPDAEVLIPEALGQLRTADANKAAWTAALLGKIHRQPDVVVPALLQSLAEPNRTKDERISHIAALIDFGPDAQAATPELRRRLTDPKVAQTQEGYWLARAILTIGGPGPELDYFTNFLVPGSFLKSYSSIRALETLGTNARPAAMELQKFMLTLTNAEDSARVLAIIKKIDPEGIYQKP